MSGQIPTTAGVEPNAKRVLDAMKENIESMKGRRGTSIQPLASTATTAEIITKINELIARIQA